MLQRDGRLVDFLEEEIDGYSDAQVGAAVRDIHRGCRKSLHDYLTISPVIEAAEEERVTIPADFDPAAIRLVGNVTGSPPFQGVLEASRLAGQLGPSPGPAGGPRRLVGAFPAEVEIPDWSPSPRWTVDRNPGSCHVSLRRRHRPGNDEFGTCVRRLGDAHADDAPGADRALADPAGRRG